MNVAVMSLPLFALAAVYTGCEKHVKGNQGGGTPAVATHAHNLKFVKCSSQNGEGNIVTIEVEATPKVLRHPHDRVVFVCKGEMVQWHTASANATIEVDFKDKSNAAKLFESHVTNLKSGSENGNATTPQQVTDSASLDLSHAYSLVVRQGTSEFRLDPHIIPTGN